MVGNTPLVYFIVLNYCSFEDTVACVKSIKDVNYQNYKLLVLDNDSPDGSGKLLSQNIDREEFIQLANNIGYAGGNNYAIEIALSKNAEYVFIVNPDIRIPSNSLRAYVFEMEKNPDIGALNPVQMSPEIGTLDSRFRNSVLRELSDDEIESNLGRGILHEVPMLLGAGLLLSRKSILKVGGFDPLYFAYGEEVDLCRRMKNFGFKLCVIYKYPVVHLRSYADKSLDEFREYLRLKGRYLYILKDLSRDIKSVFKGIIYEMRADYIAKKNKKKELPKNKVYLKVIIWILYNFFAIIKSRKKEKKGFAHLKIK